MTTDHYWKQMSETWTTVGDLYLDAFEYKEDVTLLLLDFLIYKKEVLTMDSPIVELKRYFSEKNKAKMNSLLEEYKRELQGG